MALRVLELFCGIGGMSCALKESGCEQFQVIGALDINHIALDVYQHNFPERPVWNRNVESLKSETIDKLNIDMITMSPPCQPFTRLGKQGDVGDMRAAGFLHIINLFPKINKKPSYIVMENVSGFEKSQARELFINMLKECGYNLQEFLLTPTQFGIPNSRLRYYLIAKQGPLFFNTTENIMNVYPTETDNTLSPLSKYLDDRSSDDLYKDSNYQVTATVLKRWGGLFDIVHCNSHSCCCFTKGYTRHVEGTGSIIDNYCNIEKTKFIIDKLTKTDDTSSEELLTQLSLRYFTEYEIARLHHFPATYSE